MKLKLPKLNNENSSIEDKIEQYCDHFLGTPYELLKDPQFTANTLEELLISLSEENETKFTDNAKGLDCVTFVETVLALVEKDFSKNLISLRYKNKKPTFLNRNYFFPCVDWIPNNKKITKDITKEIYHDISYAKTIIDRPSWLYNYKLLDQFRDKITLTDLIDSLKKLKIDFAKQESIVPYIESKKLLSNIDNCINRFPNVSLVWIVRPDWDVREVYENYGTHLNISHVGICIKKKNELYFYHASSEDDRVVKKEKLIDYLTKYLHSKSVKGIHITNISIDLNS